MLKKIIKKVKTNQQARMQHKKVRAKKTSNKKNRNKKINRKRKVNQREKLELKYRQRQAIRKTNKKLKTICLFKTALIIC
jgi:hypothetical protein